AGQGVGKIGFQIKARPDCVDPELFSQLRSMGLFRVFLGIEAGTETSLRQLGRGQRLADNESALQILNGLDLHVAFNLLVLNPESTLEDFEGNVAFLRGHAANPMNFCRTEIYAGTPLEQRLRSQGRLRGDYWGLDYVIGDARAERAFELLRTAFYERNFGAHPLHYLCGQVDYEHQIRSDFFGTTPELRAAAKRFVRQVNENSVAYLEEIAAAVRSQEATRSFEHELAQRVRRDDFRLYSEGQKALRKIRELPEASAITGRARAALAGAMALALVGCSHREMHPREMAPPPPPQERSAPPSDAGIDAGTDARVADERFLMQCEAAPYLPDRVVPVPPPSPPDAGPAPRKAAPDAGRTPPDPSILKVIPDERFLMQREAAPYLRDRPSELPDEPVAPDVKRKPSK
ncbi:MAG: radical SAM protein, partial [Deltaproteobacteria bacterium]|nr:radical SAM protein [Deltaproteobacteria bacterium]